LLIALAACGGQRDDGRPNVLLVVIDTARADKFGCYGHPGGLTPAVDRLAAEGVLFERALAHAPWTLPSTASLLTSLHPQEHGAGGHLDLEPLTRGQGPRVAFTALADDNHPVVEAFRAAGWRTGAVVNVDFLDEDFGLTQGVDDLDARWYASNEEVRSAAETTDQALAWLDERAGEPFFLLAHYFDAHAVYAPPAEYRRRFAAPVDREDGGFVFGTRAHMLMLRAGQLELDPALIERAERLYEAELAYVDAQVGRLFEGLAERGLEQDTLVVLTADHGEEFLEHGGFEHGHSLHEELLSVPLVMRMPGRLPAGARVDGSAALIDVAPTLCELVGLDAPASFSGRGLLAAARDGAVPERPVLSHGNFWGAPLESWESGPWKLVLVPVENGERAARLYDRATDPAELRDVATEHPAIVERLRAELASVHELLASRASGQEVELSAERRARLEALGYLGPGEVEDESGGDAASEDAPE